MSAAGASGLLICGRHFCDIPEVRGPWDAVAVRLDDVSLTDHNTAVEVCTVEPRSLGPKIVLHHIRGTRGIHSVLVGAAIAAPRLDRPLVTHGNNFRVLVALRQRGRAGVKPKNADKDNDEEEHEALPQF